MVFITEMWAFSSSGLTVMASWEQKAAVLDSSACSLLPGVLGCARPTIPLSTLALQPCFRTEPCLPPAPRWMLLWSSSSFSVSLSPNPTFYWQFPCQRLMFWGAAQPFPVPASWPLLSNFASPGGFHITVVCPLPFHFGTPMPSVFSDHLLAPSPSA